MIGTEKFESQSGEEPDSESERLLTELKFGLLSCGLRIGEDARHLMEFAKKPIRTRSGTSGGLDVELPYSVFVNAPVAETSGAYSLGVSNGQFVIVDHNGTSFPARLLRAPEYYADKTLDACEDMVRVGQMCSPDRFCYGMTGATCSLWAADDRCRFCSIGLNYQADASSSKTKYLMQVLRRAVNDASHPAKHVLLGGGTPLGDDMGACLASELTRQIKQEFDISIYVMICAPLRNEYIDQLYDSGVDELGMNVEFWSQQAWETYIPGKHRRIGKQRYLKALEHAVMRFGRINTRSIIIAGLEPLDNTLEGIKFFASMGVMPIISPFRPLRGTELEHHPTLSVGQYLQLYEAATNVCAPYDIPLGPTCVGCQNNTLAMPFGSHYHTYFVQPRNEGQTEPYYRQPARKSSADLAGPAN